MARICVEHLQSSYGRKKVLTDVSFTAQPGECIGMIGLNGSGKSTLLSILAGIRRPQGGSITYDEVCVTDKGNRKLFARYTGYVPQGNALLEELTVWDNLLLWYTDAARLKKELEEGFLNVLELHKMKKEKIYRLSEGMKKRVSIGCALYSSPPVLLLDEPGAALDMLGKEEIINYLELYRQQGNTVVLATHEERELAVCSRLYMLASGTCREIKNSGSGKDMQFLGEELRRLLTDR